MEQTIVDNSKRVQANNKHSNKVSWFRRNALDMVRGIDAYLEDKYEIILPGDYRVFKATRSYIMNYDAYGPELEDELLQLIKFRYDLLRAGKAIYAMFQSPGSPIKTQMLTCLYSKNRLDPVWNYRKSQLIRKIYRDYLKKTEIHLNYHPCHLVLTVPHKDGKFMGKEFYVEEITKCYNLLRKTEVFKRYVWGGEYGVEVKKSKTNGMHIHIHSLVFQHKKYTVNKVREKIQAEWKRITDADLIHYETLYFYKKDETGSTVMEHKWIPNKITMQKERFEVRKKFYIDRSDAPRDKEERLNEYLYGVMECIKYHFKNDCTEKVKDENEPLKKSGYDIDLMIDILNNTKGVRLYSRFGALYKVPELNFNRIQKEVPEQSDEEIQEEVMASTENVIENLINPITGEKAKEGEYVLVVGKPEMLRHGSKNSNRPNEPEIYNAINFFKIRRGFSLKEIMKEMIIGSIFKILMSEEYARYTQHFTGKQNKFHFSSN